MTKQATWISLTEASTRHGIPYISLYRFVSRASRRGDVRVTKYGQWAVNSNDLETYLWARAKRVQSGVMATKQQQAKNAIQMKRNKQKADNNDQRDIN